MPENKKHQGKQGSDTNPQNKQYNNPQQSGQGGMKTGQPSGGQQSSQQASKSNRQYPDEFDEDLKKSKHSSNVNDPNKKWSSTGGSEF
jgi:hypothetical protein